MLSDVSYQSQTLRHVQLALFEEDFALSEAERAFAEEMLVNGEKRMEAARVARPQLKQGSACVQANRWMRNPEVLRYMDWRRSQLVLRARLTEDELVEKARRVYLAAMGDLPVRKSLVQRSEEGDVQVEDLEIRDPSLSAANTAIETLRKIGGFGVERTETRHSGSVALGELSDEEREQRLQDLARKAGLALVERAA